MDNDILTLSSTGLSMLAGLLSSLLLSSPAIKAQWDKLAYKREFLLGAYFLLAWVLVGLHYAGALELGLPPVFGWPVVWQALEAWMGAAGVGQAAYTVLRRARS